MTELVVEPFTNEFGQVINPGDEVIFAATGWNKKVKMHKGVFGGVRYDIRTRLNYLKDENGNWAKEEATNWNGEKYMRPKTEIVTTREVVAVRVEKVKDGFKYAKVDGKLQKTDEINYRITNLPLMRVFKMDTSVSTLEGKTF